MTISAMFGILPTPQTGKSAMVQEPTKRRTSHATDQAPVKRRSLKAAVVGCGYAGIADHIPWYSAHPDVELVAVVDGDVSRAESCGARWGGIAYESMVQMLEMEPPDVVSVATPVSSHASDAMDCMNAGCHVLCEKPMARTLRECGEMRRCARDNDVTLGVVLDKRFSQCFGKARQIVASGEIGEVLYSRMQWSADLYDVDRGIRGRLESGGGVFQDCGSHFIDLTRWLFDAEIETVEGTIDLFNPERSEVEDHAVATFGLNNGTRCLLEISWTGARDYRHSHLEEVWVYGSSGVIKVLGNLRMEVPGIELFDRETNEWRLIPGTVDASTLEGYQYKTMVDEFVSCISEEREFSPSGEDGAKTVEGVLALYQSWYTGTRVSLPLEEDPDVSKIFARLREEAQAQRSGSYV